MKNLNNVAQITLVFWLMKIAANTLGDFIAQTLGLGYRLEF